MTLPPTASVQAFVASSAAIGLPIELAVRLALERELVLNDVRQLGLRPVAATYALGVAAAAAKLERPLPPPTAAYVRGLSLRRPRLPEALGAGLRVEIDDRLRMRLGEGVRQAAFAAAAVEEMVAWELAATLDGRSMGEWAFKTLSSPRRVAA